LDYEVKVNGTGCYDNKLENCKKYGRLYNWKRAEEVCPIGWHLPSKEEWDILTAKVGGEEKAGKLLKSKSGWNNYKEQSGNGTDNYGFSALPSGYYHQDRGFKDVGNFGYLWSSTEGGAYSAYSILFAFLNEDIRIDTQDKSYNLFNVRCVKD